MVILCPLSSSPYTPSQGMGCLCSGLLSVHYTAFHVIRFEVLLRASLPFRVYCNTLILGTEDQCTYMSDLISYNSRANPKQSLLPFSYFAYKFSVCLNKFRAFSMRLRHYSFVIFHRLDVSAHQVVGLLFLSSTVQFGTECSQISS